MIVTVCVAIHPLGSSAITVYVPAQSPLTVETIAKEVVDPLLHIHTQGPAVVAVALPLQRLLQLTLDGGAVFAENGEG